jgi:hypothetical protein
LGRYKVIENDGQNPWNGEHYLSRNGFLEILGIEMNPVSDSAQSKVLEDPELDLHQWLEPLQLNGFEFVSTNTIYEPPGKASIDHLDLQSFYLEGKSPTKTRKSPEATSLERLSLEEPVITTEYTQDRFSSVLHRPVVKKYALKLNEDDVETSNASVVDHSPVKIELEQDKKNKKDKKKKKKKKTSERRRESILDTLNFGKYVVYQNEQFYIEITVKEHPINILESVCFTLPVFLTVNDQTSPRTNFELISDNPALAIENLGDHSILKIDLKRNALASWFETELQLSIACYNSIFDVSFRLPFAINVLLPNHLNVATMTPQKFMDVLQNPPHGPFSAVGSSTLLPPTMMPVSVAIENIASQISCIVVERHPGVVSLFGQTTNGISIFGLVKEKRNKAGRQCLAMDIKTSDTVVLDWIMETLSTLSSDWLES